MRRLYFTILLCLQIYLSGCDSSSKQSVSTDSLEWQRLTIIDEKTIVFFSQNLSDSGNVIIHHPGSFFAPLNRKIKSDTMRVGFTRAENDTLAYLMKDLIVHPVTPKDLCTDFVGSLYLKIDYGNFELSGRYSSVCDWSQLSDKTRKLSAILKRKLTEAKKNNK